jgi:hypothetical protein
MANALYDTFKEKLIDAGSLTPGGFDLNTDVIKATLIDSADYTFSAAHDDYGSGTPDVPAAAKVAVSAGLGTPTVTNGVFDTADFTWSSVTGDDFTWSSVTGDPSEAIILWDDTITAPVTDHLIAFYDTGMTGMPVTPNGGDSFESPLAA